MSTDLTPYRNASLEEKRAYVQTIAAAGELLPKGLWANVKNPETGLMENKPSPGKVLLVVETGVMLGLHPMAALRGIDIIEGNPTLKPALMSALIRDAGHVLRIEQTGTVEGGDLAVTTTGIRSDDPEHPYIYTWTPHDALRAGLVDSYAPDEKNVWRVRARSDKGGIKPWEAYTARMCRWRSLGDVASAGFEDVLMGMHYTPEELGANVNANGEVVELIETPAPARDWSTELRGLTSKQEINDLVRAARNAGQYTDEVRTVALTRLGTIGRQEIEAPAAQAPAQTVLVDRPDELTEEEYERQSIAEHEEAMRRA